MKFYMQNLLYSWTKNVLVHMSRLAILIIVKGIPIFKPISIILLTCKSHGIFTMNIPTCVNYSLDELYISHALCSYFPIKASYLTS